MKKTLLLLTTLLAITIVNAQTFTADGIEYNVTDVPNLEVEVTGSALANIVIPSSVTDTGSSTMYTVTAIGSNAFNPSTTLASIELPSTVTLIKDRAFNDCSILTSVTFTTTSGITHIEERGFRNTAITDINGILSSIVSIGELAFSAVKTTSITTPITLTTLDGTQHFRSNTTSLTADLSASTNLTAIPTATFRSNTSLKTVILPSSITSIAANSFRDVSVLETLQINAVTPPTADAGSFNNADVSNIKLIVPSEATANYIAHAFWGTFNVETLSANNIKIENLNIYVDQNSILSINNSELINANVSIYDLTGQKLLSQTINNSSTIDLSNLISGIYIIRVKDGKNDAVKKIVISN